MTFLEEPSKVAPGESIVLGMSNGGVSHILQPATT